jgi:hypothetical protein
MAYKHIFHDIQAHAALHIWPHSIKMSPVQPDPYDIPNDMFCNSQILSHKLQQVDLKRETMSLVLFYTVYFEWG